MDKLWVKLEISNHCDQIMEIQPNEDWTGIQITVGESDRSKVYENFYINKEELPIIIEKLTEMMKYSVK